MLVWRLDRLSRNLSDLILLADLLGEHGVALHSLQENLNLSSASGRMFYNILETFAQFFREQLAENVKMGNDRAVKEGKWINRPKTGYNLVDGELIPSDDAPRVRQIFPTPCAGQELSRNRRCHGHRILNCQGHSLFSDLSWRSTPQRGVVARSS